MIDPNRYHAALNYDDRETFFLDNLMDTAKGNPVMCSFSPQETINLGTNIYRLYDLLEAEFPRLKIRIESAGRVSFWRDPSESSDDFLVVAINIPTYKNKDGILNIERMESASIMVASQFEKLKATMATIRKVLEPYIEYEKERLETSWVQMQANGSLSYRPMPIKETKDAIIPEAYPWIDDPDSYIRDFLNSASPILIMTGPPGTGKSTFIRHIINAAPKEFEVFSVYDEDIMKRDDLYTNFISNSDEAILVIEDADRLLERRIEDQNTTMSKILNVSDGIIDLTMKKIIFTTNLENLQNVDQALIRPGRCFDILEFRNLTRGEAGALAGVLGKDLPDHVGSSIPLSEIFNQKNTPRGQKIGFI